MEMLDDAGRVAWPPVESDSRKTHTEHSARLTTALDTEPNMKRLSMPRPLAPMQTISGFGIARLSGNIVSEDWKLPLHIWMRASSAEWMVAEL